MRTNHLPRLSFLHAVSNQPRQASRLRFTRHTFLAGGVLIALLALGANSWGAPLLTEDFNYTAGTLLTANGWTAHSSGGTAAIKVHTSGLTYSGYASSGIGNSATLAASAGEDDNKTITTTSSGSLYAAFLLNVNSSATGGDYFFHFNQNNTTFFGKVWIKKDSASSNFALGLTKSSSTGANYTGFIYSPGTTYLIVLKYTFNGSTLDDTVALYVNPTPGGLEPSPTIGTITEAVADSTGLIAVALRQGGASTTPSVIVDGIRVATTWADAVASSTPIVTIDNTGAPVAGNPTVGANDVVLFGFRLTPSASVDFTALSLTTAGTATSSDLSNFRVVYDVNGNGTYESGTDTIVSGTGLALANPISFTITGQTGISAARRYLVIANVAGGATAGHTFTGSINAAGDVTTTGTETGTAAGTLQTIASGCTTPGVPGSPSAAVTTCGRVDLSWSASSPSASTYNIYRATTPGGETTATYTGVSGTAYNDTSITPGQHYYYKITGVSGACESALSAEADNTPPTTPSAPSGTGAADGCGSVSVSWTAPGGTVTSYNIYRSTTTGNEGSTPIGTSPSSPYVDSTVAVAPQTYFYTVAAVNGACVGAQSTETSAAGSTKPAAPTSPSATGGNGSVALSWTAPAGTVTGYNVKRSTTQGSGYSTLGVGGNVAGPTFTDSTAANDITYFYVITALNSGCESANSAEVNATPSAFASIASLELGTASQLANTTGAATFTTKDGNIASLPALSLTVGQQGQAGGAGFVSSKAWFVTTQDTARYWEFTLTASSGYQISVATITIKGTRSGSGPTDVALRSSADSYAANIGTQSGLAGNSTVITFSSLTLANQSAITFRVYGWETSGGAAGGTWRIGDGAASSLDIDVRGVVTLACSAPTITLGSNPSVCVGTTSANLTYSATTGSPNQYSIVFDSAAHTAGFSDVTLASLSGSPIVITVPVAPAAGVYNGTLTVVDSGNPTCISSGYPITVTVGTKITVGANPTVALGATTANLPYSAPVNSPDQYSIVFDSAAHTAGFIDVTLASLPATPIVITVPGGAAGGTYNGTLTVKNSSTGCVSAGTAITVTIAVPGSQSIVIAEFYPGGGLSGATYNQKYIVLFNRSCTSKSISGWSVQYTSSAGTSWGSNLYALPSASIPAGGYYLIGLTTAGAAPALPVSPDTTSTINPSGTAGKLALVNSTTALSAVACPTDSSIVDFIGYGTAATCNEGGVNAPVPSNTTSEQRANSGCTDTDNNGNDFTTAAPNPRNSVSATHTCGPTATVTDGTVPICTGGSTTLHATLTGQSPWTVTWFDGTTPTVHSGVTTSPDTFLVSPTVATTTYTVTAVTDSGLCSGSGSSSGSAIVNVSGPPSINGGGNPANQTVCKGTTATFTVAASNASGYQWKIGTPGSGTPISAGATGNGSTYANTTTASMQLLNAQVADSGASFYVTVSGGGGCADVDSTAATLTVNLVTVTAPSDATVCAGSTANFSVTAGGGTPGYTYQWKKDGTSIGGATTSSYSIPSAGLGDVALYGVTVTDSAGCVTTSAAATLRVNIFRKTSLFSENFGSGSPAALPAGWTSDGVITWISDPAAASSGYADASGTGNAEVLNTADADAAAITPVIDFTGVTNGVVTFAFRGTTTWTRDLNVELSTDNGANYSTLQTYTAPGNLTNSVWHYQTVSLGSAADNQALVKLRWRVAGPQGVGTSNVRIDDVNVFGSAGPVASITPGGPTTFCSGGSVVLTASDGGGVSWSWSPGTGLSSTTAQNPTASPSSTTTYTVTVTDANGCTAQASQLVTVNPLPTVSASNNAPFYNGNYTITNGQSLALSSTGTGVSWSWSGPFGVFSTAQNPTIAAVTGASSPFSDYTYTVTATGANGCPNTASTTVRVLTTDAAGIPDQWKTAHSVVGQSSTYVVPGGNGMTLLQSYLAGVNPNCATCKLEVTGVSVDSSGVVTLTWNSQQDGTTAQRLYDVYYHTGSFSNGISWTLAMANEPPQGATSVVEDDVSAANITQRFYRVTIAGHTNDVATPEIVGVHTLHLVEGANYVSLSMLPGTNTLLSVLGTNQLPQGSSESLATTVDIWNQSSQIPGATYWLASGNGGWLHHGDNAPSNGVLLDPNKGLAITIRPGEGAQTLRIVGFVPTTNEVQVVQGANGYTVASSTFPMPIPLNIAGAAGGGDGSGLVASGFLGGSSVSRSDNLLFFNPVTQTFDTRIWYGTDGKWHNADASVTTRKLQPGEAFLIQRSTFSGHAGNITWTNTVPYTTVPQLQGP